MDFVSFSFPKGEFLTFDLVDDSRELDSFEVDLDLDGDVSVVGDDVDPNPPVDSVEASIEVVDAVVPNPPADGFETSVFRDPEG